MTKSASSRKEGSPVRPQGGEVGNQQGSNLQRLFAAVAAKNACFRFHSFTRTGKLHLILLQS